MYCRLQGYPSPLLISYKIPGIRVLWGFGVPLCGLAPNRLCSPVPRGHCWHIERISTVHHHPTLTPMNNTPFFNPSLVKDINSEQIDRLDVICHEYTSRFFNKETTDMIINTLKQCRGINRHHANFWAFNSVYWYIKRYSSYSDYVTFRKYLQTLSGIYRWHFGSFQHYTVRNSLHERIKVETHCEHCGSLGKGLIDWLISENLWLV